MRILRIKKGKKQDEKTVLYSYRTDRGLTIALLLALFIALFAIGWSETGSLISALIKDVYYYICGVISLFFFTREFFRTTTVKVEPNRITSYSFFHKEMCSVDLTKDVYYNYHRFEEYIEFKLSNQDFYGDKVKPRHFSLNYIRSNSEVYLPIVDENTMQFPLEDWHFVPGGATIVRHRDLKRSRISNKVVAGIVLAIIALSLAGGVYFFPLPYSKSTSGFEVEAVSSTVLCNKTSPETQFDTIYYDQDEEFIVAWSREFILSKENTNAPDEKEFFESKWPGITSFDFVSTEKFEDNDYFYYVINIIHLNNSVAGTKVSDRAFVFLPYYEGDTFLSDAVNELKSSGSHYMTEEVMEPYQLHAPTEEEIFENTTKI